MYILNHPQEGVDLFRHDPESIKKTTFRFEMMNPWILQGSRRAFLNAPWIMIYRGGL